jgi:hypothetical protein
VIEFDTHLKIASLTVDANVRLADGRLNLVILQTEPTPLEWIGSDASRPSTVAVINDLLNGGARHGAPVLRDLAPGHLPAVIIAPEYAFGSGDWVAIDAAVRASPQPLVLIAGFGATRGQDVLQWAATAGVTSRHLGWDQDEQPISNVLRVNGGWCWIHGFAAETMCIAHLKNHLEQTAEAQLALACGQMLLRIAFNDLDIFPLICADLVQSYADGEGTALRRIEQSLVPSRGTVRPVLVAGSTYQVRQNDNWNAAINYWLNVATIGRPTVVALANIANSCYLADEATDKWRSLSGVYARFTEIPRNQKNLPAGRAIESQNVRGAVVRDTRPQIVGGPIAWSPYVPTGNLFVWHASLCCSLVNAGISAPVTEPPPICQTEVARFLHRHPPLVTWAPRVGQGLKRLAVHLDAGDRPTSERLLRTLLHGVSSGTIHDPDRLHVPAVEHSFRNAMFALATISTSKGIVWQSDDDIQGQLRFADELTILVWQDAERTQRQILSEIVAWKTIVGYHPPLIVLCDGPHGAPPEGLVKSGRRANFGEPPPGADDLHVGGSLAPIKSDITASQFERSVACVRLDAVNSVYADYDVSKPGDEEDLKELILRLRRYFNPKAA